MTILGLQYNPMSSHYGVRVQNCLDKGASCDRRPVVVNALLQLGTSAQATWCDPNPNPEQISKNLV